MSLTRLELVNDVQGLVRETLGKYTVADLNSPKVADHIKALYAAEAFIAEDLEIRSFLRQPKGLERLVHPSYDNE